MLSILVVDDDVDTREVLSDILLYNGHQVDTVGHAEDAIARLQEQTYDGILIDLRLPDIDGWQLLDTIKDQTKSVFVAITLFDNLAVKEAVEKAGFDAYFPKPIDEQTFAGTLSQLIRSR